MVVDDGSSCDLSEVFARHRRQLDLRTVRQENAGPAAARNRGVRESRGTYIAFTDDDCLPRPDWLQGFDRQLAETPDAGLGGTVHNALPGQGGAVASQLLIEFLYRWFNRPEPTFFTSNNLCMPRAGFDAVGGFDEGFPLAAGEDRDLCSRWVARGFSLREAPAAVLDHAHPLGLRAFWRQHYGYGRGAWHYHQLRAARREAELRVEPLRFYLALLGFPFRRLPLWRAPLASGWLFLSQLANALGFFAERRRARRAQSAVAAGERPNQ